MPNPANYFIFRMCSLFSSLIIGVTVLVLGTAYVIMSFAFSPQNLASFPLGKSRLNLSGLAYFRLKLVLEVFVLACLEEDLGYF